MRIYFETKKHCWSFSLTGLIRRLFRVLVKALIVYGLIAVFEGVILMGFKILEYAGL